MDTVTIDLDDGEILLERLLGEGVGLAHDCGGVLACSSCRVIVRSGAENLAPPSEDELDMLERAGAAGPGARLACQATGNGTLGLEIPRLEALRSEETLPVAVTPQAAKFLAAQLAKHPASVAVRLAVAPSGCSGLRYRIDPADALREDDKVFLSHGLRIAVDAASLPFVQGATLDVVQEGLSRRLRFDNPNARQTCGCGESFGT